MRISFRRSAVKHSSASESGACHFRSVLAAHDYVRDLRDHGIRAESEGKKRCVDTAQLGPIPGSRALLYFHGCGQHLIGAGAYPYILGEVCPANRAGRIHEKFCRPRNFLSARSATRVQQFVAADHLSARVGQQGKRVTSFVGQIPRDVGRIDADCYGPHACTLKFCQLLFYASQLEVTKRSPVTAIKDQQHRLGWLSCPVKWPREQSGQRHGLAVCVLQLKIRRPLSHL